MLHTHLAGVEARMRQIRNGKESKPVFSDEHYDFNYQISRTLNEEFKLMPGDRLITECIYTSKFKSKMTYGGFSTTEEMCMTFPRYYPRVEMTNCGSMPWFEGMLNALGIESLYNFNKSVMNSNYIHPLSKRIEKGGTSTRIINLGNLFESYTVKSPANLQNITVGEVIDNIDWRDESVSKTFENDLGNHVPWYQGIPGINLIDVCALN